MPALDILKSLLGGSGRHKDRSKDTRKRLMKGSTLSERSYAMHSEDGSVSGHNEYPRRRDYHPEYTAPKRHPSTHRHHEPPYVDHRTPLESPHYPEMPYAPTPTYPAQLRRYELYDRPVPAPVGSPYHPSIHESHHSAAYQGIVPGFPPVEQPYPCYYQTSMAGRDSWEPIPDVHRQSTAFDPDGFDHHDQSPGGLLEEEERWQAQFEPSIYHEPHGDFVDPRRGGRDPYQGQDRSMDRDQNASGEDWGNVESRGQHETHREDFDKQDHQMYIDPGHLSRSNSQSHTEDHSRHPKPESERQSLRQKLSRMFNTSKSGEDDDDISDRGDSKRPASVDKEPSQTRSKRSASKVRGGDPERGHMRSGHTYHEGDDDDDDDDGDWPEESQMYQYIVPPGVNVIFKDEAGNEITRVGNFADPPKNTKKKHQSVPIMVIDQHGSVLYKDSARSHDNRYQKTKTMNHLPPGSPRSIGSDTSSPSTKTILISPKGEQIQIGGNTASHGSGSNQSRSQRDSERYRRG